jgi:hypothetical protein
MSGFAKISIKALCGSWEAFGRFARFDQTLENNIFIFQRTLLKGSKDKYVIFNN